MITKELAKGSTALLVLSIISQKDMYGYQIIKELEAQSENVFSLKEGTLYPILHSLEKDGMLKAYWDSQSSARKRKYYQITKKGTKELGSQRSEWETFSEAVNRVVTGQGHVSWTN